MVISFLVVLSPPGIALIRWSYDFCFNFSSQELPEDVVIVAMDEISHAKLSQDYFERWDRALHTQLLERLTEAQSKVVAFDVLFDAETTPEKDEALAQAMSRHGQVVVAGDVAYHESEGAVFVRHIRPLALIEKSAAGVGLTGLNNDNDHAVRRLYSGPKSVGMGLAEKTAQVAGHTLPESKSEIPPVRWLNHYDASSSMNMIPYHQVLDGDSSTLAALRNKAVFIGSTLRTQSAGSKRDDFRTPISWRSGRYYSGVEVHALSYLNLVRGDWYRSVPVIAESILIIIVAIVSGLLLPRFLPMTASGLGALGIVLLAVMALVLSAMTRTWFAWMIPAFITLPASTLWAILIQTQRKAIIQTKPEEVSTVEYQPVAGSSTPSVPDHQLIRRIGRGSYGEVWLARNLTGAYRAVKVVYQDPSAGAERRFEREFEGLLRIEPVSREHHGLVPILHVGRSVAGGYFYYVMEAADPLDKSLDEATTRQHESTDPATTAESDSTVIREIDPDQYEPATLRARLERFGVLSYEEGLKLGLALTSALDFLHRQNLVHRDLKPSNIIFVNGLPKLADIGLVTGTDESNTLVGTEGYFPPEGTGSVQADIFGLGMVFYVAMTVKHPSQYPNGLKTESGERESGNHVKFHEIIRKACEEDIEKRYATIQEMNADLLHLLG